MSERSRRVRNSCSSRMHSSQQQALRLIQENRPRTPEFKRGFEMLERDARAGQIEAMWYLALVYLQCATLPDADTNALHWLTEAGDRGLAIASERLANLSLRRSDESARAFELYCDLADRGVANAAVEAGYLLTQGIGVPCDAARAATMHARACALHEPLGYYSLGLRFALGAGVDKDSAFGRALLLLAAESGIGDAQAAADTYAPTNDAGDKSQAWLARLLQIRRQAQSGLTDLKAARQRPFPAQAAATIKLEAQFRTIAHPAIRKNTRGRLDVAPGGNHALRADPGAWHWHSQDPRVAVSRHFATREECAYLMTRAKPSLNRPGQYQGGGEAYADHALFDGVGTPFGPVNANAVMRVLERRIAAMAQHPLEALEPCSVIRYLPGEEYRPHADYFTAEQMAHNVARYADQGGQRLATFLLYLRVPDAGGETVYPHPDLEIHGETGLGLLHYNVTSALVPDEHSLHIGRPVQKGEKWLWRSALRERPLCGELT